MDMYMWRGAFAVTLCRIPDILRRLCRWYSFDWYHVHRLCRHLLGYPTKERVCNPVGSGECVNRCSSCHSYHTNVDAACCRWEKFQRTFIIVWQFEINSTSSLRMPGISSFSRFFTNRSCAWRDWNLWIFHWGRLTTLYFLQWPRKCAWLSTRLRQAARFWHGDALGLPVWVGWGLFL